MKKGIKRQLILTMTVLVSSGLFAGCAKERQQDQEAYRIYGISCMDEGNYEEAVQAFQMALNQSRGHVGAEEIDICYYKAQAQFEQCLCEDAITTYTAVIDYKGYGEAYFLRGCAYMKMGQPDLASSDFSAAVDKNPSDYELYMRIYDVLSGNGREAEADVYLDHALEIRGDRASDKKMKGRIYMLQGDYDNAILLLKDAVAKGDLEANFYLGEAYTLYGDSEMAEASYQAYVNSDIVDCEGLYGMGVRRMEKGDYLGAVTYLTQAYEMEEVTNRQQLMRSLMIAYEYAGDFASAADLMEEYVKLYPSDEAAVREHVFLMTR